MRHENEVLQIYSSVTMPVEKDDGVADGARVRLGSAPFFGSGRPRRQDDNTSFQPQPGFDAETM
jgi:hypothetical protein